MRARVLVPALLALLATTSAQAAVQIDIDKDNQTMTVAVDGIVKHRWPVSTGLPAYETPNGVHKAFRMEEDHYSKEWDEAPMPHSIFFTKKGHAIHGTDAEKRLGNPASHGCVRLSRANAATLFALVKEQGVLQTTVRLTGSSQVALARRPQRNNEVASRAPNRPQEPQVQMYDGNARPLPPPQRIAPQVDDNDRGYYDRYGRYVPPQLVDRGNYGAYSEQPRYQQPYAQQPYGQQPYAQQQQPETRYYGQQQYQQQYQQQPYYQQPNPYYAQPRYYRREYDRYGY